MNKIMVVGMMMVSLLFTGCATTHEKFTYGGYTESHEQKMTVFHQYELVYTAEVKGKLVPKAVPFMMNKKFDLPKEIIELGMGLYVKNPMKNYYEIWEEYEVLYENTNEPYLIKRRLSKSELPDRVLRIKLPRQVGAEYKYRVKVMDAVGSTLFCMGDAEYITNGE
jgi:hypothetical protein